MRRFGVSRTPVRDALRLCRRGFAETIPTAEPMTLLSLDNIKQMIYMRVAVETMVLRDFLANQTPMVMRTSATLPAAGAVIREPGFEPEQFTVWTRRCTPSGLRPSGVRSCGKCSRRSSSTIPGSGCWTSSRETDFMRIIGEHEEFSMIVDKNEKGLEEALKEHLYYSMKRMRRSIEVDYKDYFEEEDEEGRFVI